MTRALLLVSLTVTGCVAPVRGEPSSWRRVVLVELFTSQGCNACPAADALVRELPQLGFARDKVLPLTYHVNYWDDLGWKDPFSSPAFTARQQWYADTGKLRSPDVKASARELYTPQMVVGGAVHFSGARRNVALSQIQTAADVAAPLRITGESRIEGDVASVAIGASGPQRPDPSWRLFVALALRSARTPVASGENAGRTLEEADVVRSFTGPLPLRLGQANVVRLAKPAGDRWADLELVAFVQSLSSLQIAGAAAVKLPP